MAKDGKEGKEGGGRRRRPWVIAAWTSVAWLIAVPLFALWAMAATDDDENVALTRNDVVREASGGRTWHGTFTNRADSLYREVAVEIRFLDRNGKPVGKVGGRADRLEPGARLDLKAALPSGAAGMQVYSLQWRTGEVGRLLGPWAPWPFGHVQTNWP